MMRTSILAVLFFSGVAAVLGPAQQLPGSGKGEFLLALQGVSVDVDRVGFRQCEFGRIVRCIHQFAATSPDLRQLE